MRAPAANLLTADTKAAKAPKAPKVQEPPKDTSIRDPANARKYQQAGTVANQAIAKVRGACVAGAKIFDLCQIGDESVLEQLKALAGESEGTHGIAFPTCVNPNNIPAHYSPEGAGEKSNVEVQDGDVINIMLGAHVDGFPAIVAETLIVGESKESPVTGKKADLLHSTWNASEAAIRQLKAGGKNWDITRVVDAVAKDFQTSAVQSMLSHNMDQNVIYGPKEIIINPAKEHKTSMDTHKFADHEVYGLDILVSTSSDGKVKRSNFSTTIYKLTGQNHALKLKTSQVALKAFKEKVQGLFPANIKIFEDPRRTRLGLIMCAKHDVTLAYDIMEGKADEPIAQFFTTVAITPEGLVKYTSPSFDGSLYTTDKKVEDEDLAKLIATPL